MTDPTTTESTDTVTSGGFVARAIHMQEELNQARKRIAQLEAKLATVTTDVAVKDAACREMRARLHDATHSTALSEARKRIAELGATAKAMEAERNDWKHLAEERRAKFDEYLSRHFLTAPPRYDTKPTAAQVREAMDAAAVTRDGKRYRTDLVWHADVIAALKFCGVCGE